MPRSAHIEMPGAESPLSPTSDNEPLPTDPANWSLVLSDRICTQHNWFIEDQVK